MAENFDSTKPLGNFSAFNTFYTYSWVNNEQFYAVVPYPYREYYQRFVKQYFQWYDGFVPHFHNQSSGMFSTRLAYTTLNKLAKQTIGSKLMFNDDGVKDTKQIEYNGKKLNSLNFIEEWSKANKLTSKVVQTKEWAFVGGDACYKLDSYNGDLRPSILRKDTYFFSTDFKGDICHFMGLVYTYSKMKPNVNGENKELFYLLEEREYDEQGKPMVRLSMKKSTGNQVNNKQVDMSPETIPFENLPRDVRHKFKKDYPGTLLGEWQELPLKDLGIYIDKASEKVSFIPSLQFGESLLSNAIHILMSYDYYYTSLNINLYTAQDKIIAPQHMQPPQASDDPYYGVNQFSSWNTFMLSRIPYTNPEDNSPILWQPSTRSEEWVRTRDNLLQSLAMVYGVDDRTISSAIVPNAEKPTAREISSDEYTTTLFVENQQIFTKDALDKMLQSVLDFYGFEEEVVTVKFDKAGLTNLNNVTTITTLLKQNGLIDLKTALEMQFPNKNDVQIELMMENIKQEKEDAMQFEQQQSENDVEENMEQQNNQDTSHVPKPKETKKKGLFGRK